jgi:alcohol dehydrogenase (cytochrome c)
MTHNPTLWALVAVAFGFAAGPVLAGQQPAAVAAQIERGAKTYAARCAACHGEKLEGKSGLDLVGIGPAYRWIGQTAADLYQKVSVMPLGAPGSLAKADYADLTAFIVARNGGKPGGVLTGDPAALRQLPIGADEPGLAKSRTLTRRDISAAIAGGPSQDELNHAAASSDWMFATHDYAGQRFVDLKQIDKKTVAGLRPVCLYQLGDTNPFPTSPLVYRGAIFVTSRNAVVSIDAASCKLNWRYDRPSRVPQAYIEKMNHGPAIKDGKLVFGTHDGFLVALDAGTGKEIWVRDVVRPKDNQGGFTMSPIIVGDLVIMGPAGSEIGVKGWVGAFSLATGEAVWRFNTIPDDGEPGTDSWPDRAARQHGGGTVWGVLSYDAATGMLFVPVSNPTPDFNGDTRAGANLYTCAMVVLDIRTGKLVWYYQVSPHDTHDYDLTQASPQFTVSIDGKSRNLVVAAGKEGQLHVIDRDSHQQLYQTPVTQWQNTDVPWVDLDKSADGSLACPGALGGVQWNGPAFNPGTKTLYVPAAQWCAFTKEPAANARGWLSAVDAATGKVKWRYPSNRPMLAAVTTTSAGLVFGGELSGDLIALDADDGKLLYRFTIGGPMVGGIVSYQVGGTQYVAAVTGMANDMWQADPGSSTVVVFGLR